MPKTWYWWYDEIHLLQFQVIEDKDWQFLDAQQHAVVGQESIAAGGERCRDLKGIEQAEVVTSAQIRSPLCNGGIGGHEGDVGPRNDEVREVLLDLGQAVPDRPDQALCQGDGRGDGLQCSGIDAVEDVIDQGRVGRILLHIVDNRGSVEEQLGNALEGSGDFHRWLLHCCSRSSSDSCRPRVTQA